jgi:hypothetical protein
MLAVRERKGVDGKTEQRESKEGVWGSKEEEAYYGDPFDALNGFEKRGGFTVCSRPRDRRLGNCQGNS